MVILLNNMNLQLNSTEIDFNEFHRILDQSIGGGLSLKLENVLNGKKIIFSCYEKNHVPLGRWGIGWNSCCEKTIKPIRPVNEVALVAAVDSSSIRIAETEDGSLYAIKSGIAFAINGQALMHFKIGPILIYLNKETIKTSELDHRLAKLVLFDGESARRLIRLRVERAIQIKLSNHFIESIIVVDGALRLSPFENKNHSITKVAENCSVRKNVLVGISKSTSFKLLDKVSTPLTKINEAAYMDIGVIIQSLSRSTLGSNLLAKFESNDSPILRTDIVCPKGDIDNSIGKLLTNDSMAGGYPETLRLAHHVSTFSNTEISCLRGHLLSNYDVTELPSEDIRKTLLGSIQA
jgi:hypothetical protein